VKSALRHLEIDGPADVPADAGGFLRELGGPTAIHVRGRDRSRARAAVTLLHGNEPSGSRAVHAWLRSGAEPAVDTLLIVANVEAALRPPGFAWRMLPGHRDLNRCFLGPPDDGDGVLARDILAALRDAGPEAVIDLHNNTGHNPPYGVGLEPREPVLQLVSLFADRFVWSHLRLGALMEALTDLPAATIEVGRSGDPAADAVAKSGLARFLEREQVLRADSHPLVQVLVMPMRARLCPGVRVAVADAPDASADLTLEADLDRHNFERVEAGSAIGWVRDGVWPLELRDEEGRDRAADYFRVAGGRLLTRRDLVPIMITTDPEIAAADCLFYVVREERAPR